MRHIIQEILFGFLLWKFDRCREFWCPSDAGETVAQPIQWMGKRWTADFGDWHRSRDRLSNLSEEKMVSIDEICGWSFHVILVYLKSMMAKVSVQIIWLFLILLPWCQSVIGDCDWSHSYLGLEEEGALLMVKKNPNEESAPTREKAATIANR